MVIKLQLPHIVEKIYEKLYLLLVLIRGRFIGIIYKHYKSSVEKRKNLFWNGDENTTNVLRTFEMSDAIILSGIILLQRF